MLVITVNTDADGKTSLHVAYHNGDLNVVRLLLQKNAELLHVPDEAMETTLHEAARAGKPKVVKELLKHYIGEDCSSKLVSERDANGRTTLHWAVAATSKDDALQVVKILLKHVENQEYKPLLLWASAGTVLGTVDKIAKHPKVIKFLKKQMAPVSSEDLCQLADKLKDETMVTKLINRGADVTSVCDRPTIKKVLKQLLGKGKKASNQPTHHDF